MIEKNIQEQANESWEDAKIEKYKMEMREDSNKLIKMRLEYVRKKIAFLEKIYMTGAEYNWFSENFRDCAYKERQELCLLSSACYSLLRTRNKK